MERELPKVGLGVHWSRLLAGARGGKNIIIVYLLYFIEYRELMTPSYPIVDTMHDDIPIDIVVRRIDETNPINSPPPPLRPPPLYQWLPNVHRRDRFLDPANGGCDPGERIRVPQVREEVRPTVRDRG